MVRSIPMRTPVWIWTPAFSMARDLLGQYIVGQPVFGDPPIEHAASDLFCFVDMDLVAQMGQEVAAGEAGGTGTDDGDLFPVGGSG